MSSFRKARRLDLQGRAMRPLPTEDEMSEPRQAGWTRRMDIIDKWERTGWSATPWGGMSEEGKATLRHVVEARKLSRRERRLLFGGRFK